MRFGSGGQYMKSERTLKSNVELGHALAALSRHTGTLDGRLGAKVIRNFTANRHIDTIYWKSVTRQAATGNLSGSAGKILRNCTLEINGGPSSTDWRFKIYAPSWVYLLLIPFIFMPPTWVVLMVIVPISIWSFKAGAPRLMQQIKTEMEALA